MRDLLKARNRAIGDRPAGELSEVPDALRYLGTRHARPGKLVVDVTSSDPEPTCPSLD